MRISLPVLLLLPCVALAFPSRLPSSNTAPQTHIHTHTHPLKHVHIAALYATSISLHNGNILRSEAAKSPHKHVAPRQPKASALRKATVKFDRAHQRLFNSSWRYLKDLLAYLSTEDLERVCDALKVAVAAALVVEEPQNAVPFQPTFIGAFLAGLHADAPTIIAGLLSDVMQQELVSIADVRAGFGEEVMQIAAGSRKIAKLPWLAGKHLKNDYAREQAENLIQMFIAMSDDHRCLMVHLAERLQDPREDQADLSRQMLDVFVPLATRIGASELQTSLQQKAFSGVYPEEFSNLQTLYEEQREPFEQAMLNCETSLANQLATSVRLRNECSDVTVTGRLKEPYSLWMKMKRKGVTDMTAISDLAAIRVVLNMTRNADESDRDYQQRGYDLCYDVLKVVQDMKGWKTVGQVDDYIVSPKSNGYMSLHCMMTSEGPGPSPAVEVQIRTCWMDAIAQHGTAAHWLYKDAQQGLDKIKTYRTVWPAAVRQGSEFLKDSSAFLSALRSQLLDTSVFVFLRDGKILKVPKGARILDIAFLIHTNVGLSAVGCRVNGLDVPLHYQVNNGDVIEVTTAKTQQHKDAPAPTTVAAQFHWFSTLSTRQARNKLRHYFVDHDPHGLLTWGWIRLFAILLLNASTIKLKLGRLPDAYKLNKLAKNHTTHKTLVGLLRQMGAMDDETLLATTTKFLNLKEGDLMSPVGTGAGGFIQVFELVHEWLSTRRMPVLREEWRGMESRLVVPLMQRILSHGPRTSTLSLLDRMRSMVNSALATHSLEEESWKSQSVSAENPSPDTHTRGMTKVVAVPKRWSSGQGFYSFVRGARLGLQAPSQT